MIVVHTIILQFVSSHFVIEITVLIHIILSFDPFPFHSVRPSDDTLLVELNPVITFQVRQYYDVVIGFHSAPEGSHEAVVIYFDINFLVLCIFLN